MKIDDRNPYEGMHIGKMAEKREKILQEVSLDKDKMDSFMKEDNGKSEKITIKLDLGKLKKAISKGSGGAEDSEPASGDMREISLDFGDVKAKLTKVFQKFETAGKVNENGELSSLDMDGYMIPANEGRVAHICLTYGHYSSVKENYLEAMKTFVSKMPSAKFTVLTTNEAEKEELEGYVKQWAKDGNITEPQRVNIVNSGQGVSIWAQDSALVVGNKLVEQDRMGFPGYGDRYVAQEIAKATPEVKHQKLEGIFVDGGNQLAGSDKLFIGSDAVAFMVSNMKSYPSKYNKIKGDLKLDGVSTCSQEELAKLMLDRTFPHQKVIIVGYQGQQPAFHIDMAMTPLGKTDPETGKAVITVGDPSMASRILLDIKKNDPEKYAEYEKAVCKKIPYAPKHPLDYLIETVSGDEGLQEKFDAIAKGLEKSGYKIDRVPYMGSTQTRSVPWITYNNSVIDGDNIFIPNYGIPELDDIGNNTYRKYGYTPVPIDMTAISSLQGAINCITKVVERKYTA